MRIYNYVLYELRFIKVSIGRFRMGGETKSDRFRFYWTLA